MCGKKCSVATVIVGVILVVVSCIVSFVVVPSLVQSIIIGEVTLVNDTIQMERFETVPFPMDFAVTVFTISNPEEVLNGMTPIMTEVGPYVYNVYQRRNITSYQDDLLTYHRVEHFEFNAEASFPLTEDDIVTTINIPYHAIIQIAEMSYPNLLSILNSAMGSVFGVHNSPIMTVRVGDLLFDGVRICQSPGLLGAAACRIIRSIGASAQNLAEQDDGSLVFSVLAYKNHIPSLEYEVYRGLEDHTKLGDIWQYGGLDHFIYWDNENSSSTCNMIKGTDSGIYAPFIDRNENLYAINTDICRSAELRYQYDDVIDGIPTLRYSANEWFLSNEEGCYCLNVTEGIRREDGCLLEGAMELYTCVGAMLVLTYPHFLYADRSYSNTVLGMTPDEERHRIYVDIEPNTGTPIRGAKRAQFNIFQRPIPGIPDTTPLRLALTPIVWIDESFSLPEEFRDELRNRLLASLNLVDILIPVLISACALVLLIGIACTIRAKPKAAINKK